MEDRTCSLGDGKPVRGYGWCNAHYKRWYKYGDPLGFAEPALRPESHNGEDEEWQPIAGYEGLYEVSSLGRVWSVPRIVNGGKHIRGGILKPTWSNTDGRGHGYLSVKLSRDGITATAYVHQLVADAFLGRRPPGQQVRHGPNGELDNRASQLCYGTPDENGADMVRDGNSRPGTESPMAKLTDADVIEIRRRRAAGELQKTIAARFGVSRPRISTITNGKAWRHLLPATPPPDGVLF